MSEWITILGWIFGFGGIGTTVFTAFLYRKQTKKLKEEEVTSAKAKNFIVLVEQLQKQVDRLEERLKLQDEKLLLQQRTISDLFSEKNTLDFKVAKLVKIIAQCYECSEHLCVTGTCPVKTAYDEFLQEDLEKRERKLNKKTFKCESLK